MMSKRVQNSKQKTNENYHLNPLKEVCMAMADI
jgi:hypothetical protein